MRDLLALLIPSEVPPGTPLAAGVEQAQALLAAARPETLVVIDAGWRPRAFAVATAPTVQDEAARYRGRGAPELARALIDTAISFGLPAFSEDAPLTPHTAAVLQRLWPAPDVPILSLGVAMAAPPLLQEFGQAIATAARKLGVQAVSLCVGAIAHDHQAEHDLRENPAVRRFGEQVLERLTRSCGEDLFEIDGALWVQARPETDLCHLSMLLGTTGVDAECEVLGSFSGPGLFSAAVALYRAQGLPFGGPLEWEATDHPKPL